MLFPKIDNIDMVRDAIKGRPEFSESDKGDYIVFNYHVAMPDSFDCPIRRECRGLIFSKDGRLMSRPYHKFFNMNEKPETQSGSIDWSQEHNILHKLDGSMIRPLVFGDNVRWATKMGITDVAMLAESYAYRNPSYNAFAKLCDSINVTPIFEFVSPANRIVLSYPQENMILTAVRNNLTGEYATYDEISFIGTQYQISVVSHYHNPIDDLRQQVDIEGVVVRFESGLMVKVKTDWYVAIHKARENILHEKNVIRLILEEKLDDILPDLPKSDVDKLERYMINLNMSIIGHTENITGILERTRDSGMSKKDFAINIASTLNQFDRITCFACWDGKDVRTEIINNILRKTGSQTSIDSIRDIIGTEWN